MMLDPGCVPNYNQIGTQWVGDQKHLNINNLARLAAASENSNINIIAFTNTELQIGEVVDLKGIRINKGALYLQNQLGAITIHAPVRVSGHVDIVPN